MSVLGEIISPEFFTQKSKLRFELLGVLIDNEVISKSGFCSSAFTLEKDVKSKINKI